MENENIEMVGGIVDGSPEEIKLQIITQIKSMFVEARSFCGDALKLIESCELSMNQPLTFTTFKCVETGREKMMLTLKTLQARQYISRTASMAGANIKDMAAAADKLGQAIAASSMAVEYLERIKRFAA